MKFKNRFQLLIVLLSFLSQIQAAPTEKATDFSGFWKNQRGSTLDFIQLSNQLNGTFVTAVAQTRACIGHKAPFVGHSNSNTFSLSVDMTGCGSPLVLAITGIVAHKNGKEELKTQAIMQYRGKDTWNSQILNTDIYTRMPAKKHKSN
ncbi:hypothetical protein EOPP23_03540 [Endozoicomonas sp. OPT23]|uniref:avidin/streptavidin family protein n=1 Tax=Endozoicomonas sp. OPT23 TaxID=2072845 RepID=UPI00129AD1F6|nr:avidin/streptavidin family protein [Endozoicomonas sp. OPT23]MRI32073.1 hypothetical protein [Endozoicomonas sp. OPT23]